MVKRRFSFRIYVFLEIFDQNQEVIAISRLLHQIEYILLDSSSIPQSWRGRKLKRAHPADSTSSINFIRWVCPWDPNAFHPDRATL